MACRSLQRHQHYYKLQMLEMIDLETREKEVQGFMIVHEDNLTSYKPVVYPNLVRFNEEVDSELGFSHQQQDHQSSNTESLLDDIIRKLEKTNLMHEKLAQLRKLQKKREKKHILSERIESETSGTEVIAAAQ
jgi:hypothetical protein